LGFVLAAACGALGMHGYLNDVPQGLLQFADSGISVIRHGSPAQTAQFSLCASAVRHTCVVDGDTIWLEGEKIRLVGIDAPEVSEPRCSSEHALGRQATMRLQSLLNEGPFEIVRLGVRNTDRYGRLLRDITRNGRSLGGQLVEEGLAADWTGTKPNWCG
jgi:endonuclease YncB( thermonuclease family)